VKPPAVAPRAMLVRRLRHLALIAYLMLIVLSLLWEGWLAPAKGVPAGFWLTIKTAPLLVPLFGLLYGRPYTYAWASMLVLPYFMEGLILAYQHRAAGIALHGTLPYAVIETVVCLVFIVCAAFYARLRADELRAQTD
jgi:uncharacterized membrane protein